MSTLYKMISYIIIVTTFCIYTTTAAIMPPETSTEPVVDRGLYSNRPNEILPIQPVLVYPKFRNVPFQGRTLLKDNEIIYVKLLKRKSYRPQRLQNQIDYDDAKELQMKDIFYVKALANGQFSHNRLKLYRLPEFYAISVYKKGELLD